MGKFDAFNLYLLLRITMALAAGFIIGSERKIRINQPGLGPTPWYALEHVLL
ncbi:hypothetical protein [uncultured Anaerococcus sp.]|uniref:hypothetical protein n=1 Tax=uncultured Anaerococcus sp. TaxID=293428 RepID=UPI0028055BAA|nr:hypothetical protein [uncultured Anaerococcus sp.]